MSTIAKLPKTLKLATAKLGGRPHLYATNVFRNNDYTPVASYVGDLDKENEIYVDMRSEFDTFDYLEQVKAHLREIRPGVVFANEQTGGGFFTAVQVLEKAKEHYKLMDFEIELIQINPDKLHEIYLAAKPKKLSSLPHQYDYEAQHSQYPIIQVFDSMTRLIHG